MDSKEHKGSTSWVAFLVLVVAAVAFWPATAHADTYIDYTVNGTFDSGGTLSGTFTLDTTNSTISAANLVADGVDFTCPDVLSNGCYVYTTLDGGVSAGFLTGSSASQFLMLTWPDSANPSGFSLTTQVYGETVGSYCQGCASAGSQDFLASGSAIDAPPGTDDGNGNPTSTPEPGTWLLLLAGLAGMGFLGLRRRAVATAFAS